MKKNKLFAPFLTLIALAIALFCLIRWHYSTFSTLCILLIVFIVFYTVGSMIQKRINKFVSDNEERAREEAEREGAVIEKETPDESSDSEEKGDEHRLPPLTGETPRRPGMANDDSEET